MLFHLNLISYINVYMTSQLSWMRAANIVNFDGKGSYMKLLGEAWWRIFFPLTILHSNPYFMEIDTAARFFECILLVLWTLQGKCHLILITRRNIISHQESLASYRVITGPRKAYLFNVTAPFTFFFYIKIIKKQYVLFLGPFQNPKAVYISIAI